MAALWAIGRVGFGTIPGLPVAASNAFGWPSNVLSEYSAFAATSPIGAAIFTAIGINDPKVFLLLHMFVAIMAVGLTLWSVFLMLPKGGGSSAFRLVILSPWVALLVIFLGSYDPFTVLAFSLLLLAWRSRHLTVTFLTGVILGFQHFEQSVFAVIAASLTAFALKDRLPPDLSSIKKFLATLGGLVSGKLVLTVILINSPVSEAFGRSTYWTLEWFRISLVTSVNFWAVFLLSLFAGSWGLILFTVSRIERQQRWILFAALIVCLVPAVITLDHTRVFVMISMLSLTLVTIAAFRDSSFAGSKERKLIEALAWVIVPITLWVSMDGTPYLNQVGSLDQMIIFISEFGNL